MSPPKASDAIVRRLCLGMADGCSVFEPCPACREAFSSAVLAGAMAEAGITEEAQVVAFLDAYAKLRGELAAMVRQAAEEDLRRHLRQAEDDERDARAKAPEPAPKSAPKLRSVLAPATAGGVALEAAKDEGGSGTVPVPNENATQPVKEEGVGT